jgi:perosamine synthetase
MSSFIVPKNQWMSPQFMTARAASAEGGLNGYSGKRLALFWARSAIFYGLSSLNVSPGDRVLVPSYICRAAVEPIVAYGANVDFYRVHRDCRLDFEDIVSRITSSTKALLAVHYFGFPQEIGRVQALCRRHRIFLIEDCAHVLEGHSEGRPLGSFGDVSVFSWKKFLPVYDGADLVLNNVTADPAILWEREKPLFTLKVAKNLIEDAFGWSTGPILAPFARLLGEGKSKPATAAAPAISAATDTDSFDPSLIRWSMSRLSRWVKAHSDIPAIVRARRDHYQYLHDRLMKIPGISLLHSYLPDGACPWILPLVFDGITDAHLTLRKLGIPAVTWGGVRPASLRNEDHPDADFLYDNLVFLPVHQSLTKSDLDVMVETASKIK